MKMISLLLFGVALILLSIIESNMAYAHNWSFTLDDDAVADPAAIDVLGNHNGTMTNSPTTGQSGLINQSVKLDEGQKEAIHSNITSRPDNFCTWSAVKHSSTAGGIVFRKGNSSSANDLDFMIWKRNSAAGHGLSLYYANYQSSNYAQSLPGDAAWHIVVLSVSGYGCYQISVDNASFEKKCVSSYVTDHPISTSRYDDHGSTIDDAYRDEWTYIERNCTQQDVIDINNNLTRGNQYPFTQPGDSTPPNVTVVYPVNTTHYNDFNGTLILDLDEAGNCSINDSDFDATQVSDTRTKFINNTNLAEKNYSIAYYCNDNSGNWNNESFWFVYDKTYPVISLYSPLNESSYDKKLTNTVLLNLTYNDLWLWKTNTTIRDSSGTTRHTNYSGELGATTEWYNLSYGLNISAWPADNYTLIMEAVDTATDTKLNEDPDIIKDTTDPLHDKTTYKMKYGDVKFYYPKNMIMNSHIKEDRITQEFNSKIGIIGNSYLDIEADKLTYLKDSTRPCHIILNDFGMDGYKWDCIGLNNPKISKVSNTRYRFSYFEPTDTIETKSLSGLNYINSTTNFLLNFTQHTLYINYSMSDFNMVLPDKICFRFADNMQFCFNGTATHH